MVLKLIKANPPQAINLAVLGLGALTGFKITAPKLPRRGEGHFFFSISASQFEMITA